MRSISIPEKSWSDAIAGYELFAERRDGVLKIVLEPGSAGD